MECLLGDVRESSPAGCARARDADAMIIRGVGWDMAGWMGGYCMGYIG